MDSEGDTSGDTSESESESSWLGGLVDSFSTWFSGLGSWLQEGFTNVTTSITQSISNLKDVFDTIGTFIEDGFKSVVDGITQGIEDLKTTIDNIVINIKEMLKELFIPKFESFGEIVDIIKNKFPIIFKVKSLLEEISVGDAVYSMGLELNFYGYKIEIVDVSWASSTWYKTFRSVFVVFIYLKYLVSFYKKIPRIIRGGA